MSSTSLLALRAPSANRVYAEASGALSAAEARWVLGAHLDHPLTVREREIGGMAGIEVTLPHDPQRVEHAARLLSSCSSTLGVLEILEGPESHEAPGGHDGAQPLLRPLAESAAAALRHPSDLETIQKYPGKTNEQFTALLVNLAAALSTRRSALEDGTLQLLDPMCGRGTTLNRALRLGLSPVGAEIDRKDVESYRGFLSTWLRTHRYKHTLSAGSLRRRGKQLGTRLDVELAADRAAQKAGRGQSLTVYGCDTRHLADLLPSGSVDAIVADLPYGVQHGTRSSGGWDRSPLEALAQLAPSWRTLLRSGGGMALAYNRHTLETDRAAQVLEDSGLELVSGDGALRHRVDQSIDRDVLLVVPSEHPERERLAALRTPSTHPEGSQEDQP